MLNSMNNPLKVALMSISPHNRAILEFFFAGAGKKIFTAVPTDQAEALIIDFDHPGGRQEWQEQNTSGAKPAIVISVKETVEDLVVWVPKPLTSKALAGAAEDIRGLMLAVGSAAPQTPAPESEENIESLRALLDKQAHDLRPFGVSKAQSFKAPPPAPSPQRSLRTETLLKTAESVHVEEAAPSPANISQATADTAPGFMDESEQAQHFLRTEDVYIPPPLEEAEISDGGGSSFSLDERDSQNDPLKYEQRQDKLCGREDVILRDNWQESTALYTPENYLLTSLVEALNLSHKFKQYVQVELGNSENASGNGHYMLLMPDVNLAYSSLSLSSDDLAALSAEPLQSETVQLHLPSTNELATLEETIQRDAENTYDLESLIWTVSLLSSRGRLNRNADLNQPLRLKHWPNMTRLEPFPHAMQIAAAWQQRAGTVFDVSDWFDIPQRYVIAFYNAAHTLSLFTIEQASSSRAGEKAASGKNRGLFSRLLKRLLGGGAK